MKNLYISSLSTNQNMYKIKLEIREILVLFSTNYYRALIDLMLSSSWNFIYDYWVSIQTEAIWLMLTTKSNDSIVISMTI